MKKRPHHRWGSVQLSVLGEIAASFEGLQTPNQDEIEFFSVTLQDYNQKQNSRASTRDRKRQKYDDDQYSTDLIEIEERLFEDEDSSYSTKHRGNQKVNDSRVNTTDSQTYVDYDLVSSSNKFTRERIQRFLVAIKTQYGTKTPLLMKYLIDTLQVRFYSFCIYSHSLSSYFKF